MRHENFDPGVYEQLSDGDKLKLVEQITKSLKAEIDDKLWDIDGLQSQIEDLEFDVENIRGQQQPFLEERRRLQVLTGLKPCPGQIRLFNNSSGEHSQVTSQEQTVYSR